jgi:glycosyltransferase involved in cell wall biosynthesis
MPKKIMYFDHTASLGGGEISLLHLVQCLDLQRYVPVVVLSTDGPLRKKLEEAGVETHILPLSSDILETRKDTLGGKSLLRLKSVFQTLVYTRRLARFIRFHRADILHTNSLKSDIIGGIAGRRAQVPVIWHVRDRITNDYLPRRAAQAFRWLCRILPDYIITNSASTLETLCLPKQSKVARVVYNGITQKNVRVVHDGIVPVERSSNDPEQTFDNWFGGPHHSVERDSIYSLMQQ